MTFHIQPVIWEIRHSTSFVKQHPPKPLRCIRFLGKLERKANDGDGLIIITIKLALDFIDGFGTSRGSHSTRYELFINKGRNNWMLQCYKRYIN